MTTAADGARSVLTVGLADDATEKPESRCVLKLRTTSWRDAKGLHTKRSLTFLRRQCVGLNGLEEDASAVGVQEAIANVINLGECKDGIYEAVVCNVSHDWETGYADDWNYKLVPISTPNVEKG